MAGINKALLKESLSKSTERQDFECIFISYQRTDKETAKAVGDYILSAGLDIYFDEYDKDLKLQMQCNNPQEVTNCILKGIKNSSHMVCLVSPATLDSKWVPFEIGYGYDKTHLRLLTLRGIPYKGLPEYLRATKVIRDIYDLNSFIAHLANSSDEILKSKKSIKEHNNAGLLKIYMDPIVLDVY